jgi:hypothetical protein
MRIIIKQNIYIIFLLALCHFAAAQPTFNDKANREEAFLAVKEMRYGGVLVVRLKTNHIKIKSLQRELSNPNLKPGKRKRIQGILDETISRKDAINTTMANAFLDSFRFCPVYLSYDTSANTLKTAKNGIFLNRDLQIDPTISIPDTANIFIAYYHEKSGDYPSDGLMIRRLSKTLNEPFPHYTAIKESFINEMNTPRLRKVIVILDDKLGKLLARAEKRE